MSDHHPLYPAFTVPLSSVQFEWLGMLCSMWAQVEFMAEAGIYHLKGLSFTEGRSSEAAPRDIRLKLTKLAALAGDTLQGKERRTLLALCERGGIAARKRNLAVHGQWMPNQQAKEVTAVSWFKVPVGDELNVLPFPDLPPLVEEAANLSREFYAFFSPRGALKEFFDAARDIER